MASRGSLDEAAEEDVVEQTAFPIGRGGDYFLFTVDILGWGGNGAGLQRLPEADEGGMWLSYILFKSMACTDRVYSLEEEFKGGSGRRSTDVFRLRSAGSGADLAAWFSGGDDADASTGIIGDEASNRWLQIFLCAPKRVLAMARLDLHDLLLQGRAPEDMTADFFPHESFGRFEMEEYGENGPLGVPGGVWVDVRVRLERDLGEGSIEEGMGEERGRQARQVSSPAADRGLSGLPRAASATQAVRKLGEEEEEEEGELGRN
eukprot:evm.model.NODE_15311_length_8064_cov_22.691841.1